MTKRIAIEEYISKLIDLPVIDVRTPAEYEQGHIPGAENIPLFSNEERAIVGTAYKQESVEKAYELGYEFVGPKLESFVKESRHVAGKKGVIVYCWRGGMRSRSFADHISENGIHKVHVIEGGYKAFRTYALNSFEMPKELLVLGGYTGSGKTRILHELAKLGEQVVDLEGIASHRGSAFGGIGMSEQPKNEHFTNLLFWKWKELDMTRRVWLEDESIHIGRVFIPEVLFQRMRQANVFFLDISKELRSELLVSEYAGISHVLLERSVNRISKRLGGLRTKEALEALLQKDYYTTAYIALDYYDKFYRKGLERREQATVSVIPSDTIDPVKNAEKVLASLKAK